MDQQTERVGRNGVTLRHLVPAMAHALATLADDAGIAMYLRDVFPHPYTKQDAVNYINFISQAKHTVGWGIFENDSLAGVISLSFQEDIYRHSAEIGYWLGKHFCGRGVMTEAVGIVCNVAFYEMNLVRIFAGVFENNPASRKVLLNNGFEEEGIRRKAVLKNKILLDDYMMAKLKI